MGCVSCSGVAARKDPFITAWDKAHVDGVLAEWHAIPEAERTELASRGIRAMMLAPDIPTYQALMRGETVPTSKLDPEAVKRYGLK